MRMVFYGSGDVAVPCLQALHEAGHEIPMVVSQPPRQAGRGGKVRATPLDAHARGLGLRVEQVANVNVPEHLAAVGALAPSLLAVVDFGQKIGQALRDLAPHGAVNMHASLLPALRGAAPVNWAIIHGLTTTGVTTFELVDRMDAGPILLQESVAIDPEATAEELRAQLAGAGAELMVRTAAGLEAGTIEPHEQDPAKATLAPKLSKADGVLDFSASSLELANRIRGTWPWPGATADFIHEGRPPVRVILARARALITGEPEPGEPGVFDRELRLHVGGGRLEILELKVAGKRLMAWRDFVNGYRVEPGDRLVGAGGE